MKTACVFAHYDPHGKVDEYVLYYLRELQKVVDLIQLVTTARLCDAALSELGQLGVEVIQRENEGYDFYSYKLGIEQIDLSQFDELVLCNDSVYGPFSELSTVFNEMRARGVSFWGLTDSFDYQYHLQSYFLVFTGDVFQSRAFEDFWCSVRVLDDKKEIIRRYEVGLSRSLESAGFGFEAMAVSQKVGNLRHISASWRYYFAMVLRRWKERNFWADSFRILFGRWQLGKNATHVEWKSLMGECGVPFIKVALLRDNPKGLDDLDEVYGLINSLGEYPVRYIEDHMARVRDLPPN